jgi:hypothetical protein
MAILDEVRNLEIISAHIHAAKSLIAEGKINQGQEILSVALGLTQTMAARLVDYEYTEQSSPRRRGRSGKDRRHYHGPSSG